MIKAIIMDVEGTTTSINFVHKVLFPYATKNLKIFIEENLDNVIVKSCIKDVLETVKDETGYELSNDLLIDVLLHWIKEDRKHPSLKLLQGMVWRTGYEKGDFKGHIYADVPPILNKWKKSYILMGIYSSGSIEAQKLLFSNSDFGDLSSFFSSHFDTGIGNKKEFLSYRNITKILSLKSNEALFLSDVEAELDAARMAGMHTIQLVREETIPSLHHPIAVNFHEAAEIMNGELHG